MRKIIKFLFFIFLVLFFGCNNNRVRPVSKDIKLEFRLAQDYKSDGLEMRILNRDTIYLHKKIELTNSDIAYVTKAQLNNAIILTFTKKGNEKISKLSIIYFGKMLAILVDDKILIAPKIMGKVSHEVQITGRFSNEKIDKMFDELTREIKEVVVIKRGR